MQCSRWSRAWTGPDTFFVEAICNGHRCDSREAQDHRALRALCALGGAVSAPYQMYIGPETVAGLSLSLNMASPSWPVACGRCSCRRSERVFTRVLAESQRVAIQGSAALKALFGSSALALEQAIYGLLLVVFIVSMPKGIPGPGAEWRRRLARR